MDLKVIICCIFLACIAETGSASTLEGVPRFPKIWDENSGPPIFPNIVGGTQAVAGEFRGKISIQTTAGAHLCGGTLIHESHVLTSAFCVTSGGNVIHPRTYRLMGDDLTISVISGNPNRQLRGATHVFVHPQFNMFTFTSNLAVIRTDSPYVVSPTFHPVTRADDSPVVDTLCSVAGWGSIFHNGPISFQLLRVNATVISRAVCNSPASYNGLVRAGMFCAGTMAGGQDACEGDGGGGLICDGIVTGIVSWGLECGFPNFPSVYVDIAVYNVWINSTIVWDGGDHENIPTPTPIPGGGAEGIFNSIYLIVVNIAAVLLLK